MPCSPWANIGDAHEILPDTTDLDENALTEGLTVASEILYRLSGRQYAGVCNDIVRPCRRSPVVPPWWTWVASWGNCACEWWRFGNDPTACGCARVPQITLGAYPIREVTEVRIDGAVLSEAAYRVDDRRWLVRIDGDLWPQCQDLTKDPLTDDHTFQVSFSWGAAPIRAGVLACAEFGAEIARAIQRKPECRLPARIQSLVSQGVTVSVLDPMKFIDEGKTGLYLTDLFLAAVNPAKLRRASSVLSPDIPRPVRRTATTPGS